MDEMLKIEETQVVERIVEKSNPFLLGQNLVESGIIKNMQLQEALKLKRDGEKIGEALIRLGYCTEDQIFQTMAKRARVHYLPTQKISLDKNVVKLLPRDIIAQHKIIPIFRYEDKIVVIMENPLDILAAEVAQEALCSKIIRVMVSDTNLKRIYREIFSIEKREETVKKFPIVENINVVDYIDKLLVAAIENGASDIHIDPRADYTAIRFRLDGVLSDWDHVSLGITPNLVSRIKIIGAMDVAQRRIPQDGRYTFEHKGAKVDMRVASVPIGDEEKITIRVINNNKTHISIEELGIVDGDMLSEFKRLYSLPHGFIVATGPTGCGKSTTLHALLARTDYVEKQVITLEDPVEIKLDGINQISINNKAGVTFEAGLRSILRSDPDIIMVGEIRDVETAKIAVNSAMTGHLIFTSLHANESFDAPVRLLEMGINSYVLSSSLAAIVSQRLVRQLCPHCKKSYEISRNELNFLCSDFPKDLIADVNLFYKSCGCQYCNYKGYKGRIGVFELLRVDDDIKKCILNQSSSNTIKEVAIKNGMKTLKYNGFVKVVNGETSIEEILKMIL